MTFSIVVLLILLQAKHLFADYFLQTARMLSERSTYLHLGRVQHVVVHMLGSALALLVVGVSLPLTLLVIVLEGLAHFHIDWGKGVWSDAHPATPADALFWRGHGVDQFLHQLTYAVMIWAVI